VAVACSSSSSHSSPVGLLAATSTLRCTYSTRGRGRSSSGRPSPPRVAPARHFVLRRLLWRSLLSSSPTGSPSTPTLLPASATADNLHHHRHSSPGRPCRACLGTRLFKASSATSTR
jgi:hypothetical protein